MVETENSSGSFDIQSFVSSNRKRRNNQQIAKNRRTKRASSLALPVIALLVGLALIVAFSGVFKRPASSGGTATGLTAANSPASPSGNNASAVQAEPANLLNTTGSLESALSDSERAGGLINQGTDLFQQGQFEAAATNYAAAVKLLPDDETAHFNLALALARLGKPAEATQEYLEALRLFPDYVEAHNNLGNLFSSQGKLAEAAEHLSAAATLTPDSASAQNNLGTVFVKQRKVDEAARHFAEAVRLMPDYVEARCNLGHAYLTQGKLDQAAAEFQEALRLKPDFEPAQRGLARLNQQRQAGPLVPNSPVPLR